MIKINQDLKMEILEKFTFSKNMQFRTSFMLPKEVDADADMSNEDVSNSDMCFIFSAVWTSDASRLGEHTDFELVRIGTKGKRQSRFTFDDCRSDIVKRQIICGI